MVQRLGWDFVYSDDPQISVNHDIVLIYSQPHHNIEWPLEKVLDQCKGKKVIGYLRDIQSYGKPHVEKLQRQAFERFDVILSPYNQQFLEWWPEYVHKMVYFPMFFAPAEWYQFDTSSGEKHKFLLSGATNPKAYLFRQYILDNARPEHVDYRHSRHAIGQDYPKLLQEYFGIVTSSGRFKNCVAKLFEGCAAGCLLLTDTIQDMQTCGFEPWVHYVPVTVDTVLSTIAEILKEPELYEDIRVNGVALVWHNHGLENRFNLIEQVIDDL